MLNFLLNPFKPWIEIPIKFKNIKDFIFDDYTNNFRTAPSLPPLLLELEQWFIDNAKGKWDYKYKKTVINLIQPSDEAGWYYTTEEKELVFRFKNKSDAILFKLTYA